MNNICLKCSKNKHCHYINIMDNRNKCVYDSRWMIVIGSMLFTVCLCILLMMSWLLLNNMGIIRNVCIMWGICMLGTIIGIYTMIKEHKNLKSLGLTNKEIWL